MEFCEKCRAIIIVQDDKPICPSCGFKPKKKPKIESSERLNVREGVAVIKEKEGNVYPIVDMECPKCESKKAYFWTTQTRAADESETKFYKCVKCEHTWRKYR
jgi:transcription factor S